MEQLREWLFAVIAAAICLAVLDAMVPKGAIRGIAKITGGLVMCLVVLRPFTGGRLPDLLWEYDACQQQIDQQIDVYRQDYRREMETIIESRTGAYISEKAEQLGIVCRVTVETEVQNDVPVPTAVRLNTEKDAALAAWIEQEIGIGEARQYWEEEQ